MVRCFLLCYLIVTMVTAMGQDAVTDIERVEAAARASEKALSKGDYLDALANYRLGRLYSPDDEADDMLRLLGSEIAFSIGDYDLSCRMADSVSSPKYLNRAATHRVRALTLLGKHERAVFVADSTLSLFADLNDPDYASMLQNRGYAFWDWGKLEKAAADLRLASGLVAHSTDCLNILGNLAIVESESGNHETAIKLIGEVVKGLPRDSPDGIIALRKQGEIFRRAGLHSDADRVFKEYFRKEKGALIYNLPNMSAAERLNYWVREKALLSRCFDAKTDADFQFDVALFRRLTSLLGMRDSTSLSGLIKLDHTEIRKALRQSEAAVEMISYLTVQDKPAYAAIVLPKTGPAKWVDLITASELSEPNRYGSNSIEDALRKESKALKNELYSDTALAQRFWKPILESLPDGTRHIYFAPEGIFHLWGIEHMPCAELENYRLHRVTTTAALTNRNAMPSVTDSMLVIGGLDYNANEDNPVEGSGNHDATDALISRGVDATFPYLKGTLTEVDSIGRLISGATVAHTMGEGRLKSMMPRYDLVHIATHGYSFGFGVGKRPQFLSDSLAVDYSLLTSGLALSGANLGFDFESGEDGLLSAREICELDLNGVDFVILSACRTAVGDVNDEGSTGLVRALKMAGVKSIIATLWEVDDRSTMLFMQAFHKALAEGYSKNEAFNRARNRVSLEPTSMTFRPFSAGLMARSRQKAKRIIPPYSEPYYWAPFILIDDF